MMWRRGFRQFHMPDLSAALLLASVDPTTSEEDESIYEAVVADARHVPVRWSGVYEQSNEITLKDVLRGPYPNVRMNRAQFRYYLPATPCSASRALLAQLREPDLRLRSRVHLFQVRDDVDSEYYLGAHVVVSGSYNHVVLHLLRDQPDREHIRREVRERPCRRLAESIVRAVVPSSHRVRSDMFDAVYGVRALPVDGRQYREKVADSDVGDLLSADVGRSLRVTWRVVLMEGGCTSASRENVLREKCRALRDVCMQRVVLVRVGSRGEVTFRDFCVSVETEREYVTREELRRNLFPERI